MVRVPPKALTRLKIAMLEQFITHGFKGRVAYKTNANGELVIGIIVEGYEHAPTRPPKNHER